MDPLDQLAIMFGRSLCEAHKNQVCHVLFLVEQRPDGDHSVSVTNLDLGSDHARRWLAGALRELARQYEACENMAEAPPEIEG